MLFRSFVRLPTVSGPSDCTATSGKTRLYEITVNALLTHRPYHRIKHFICLYIMASMNGVYVQQNWQYDVNHEFHHPVSKQPATWCSGSPHRFEPGTVTNDTACESYLPFAQTFDSWSNWSINSSHTRLAIAKSGWTVDREAQSQIFVYDLTDPQSKPEVLGYHEGRLDSVLFSSTNPHQLVSSYEPRRVKPGQDLSSTIIIRDLSIRANTRIPISEVDIGTASSAAISSVESTLPSLEIMPAEKESLTSILKARLVNLAAARATSHLPKIHGRLTTSFNSAPFSHDGQKLLIMPGERGQSNSIDASWVVEIYSVSDGTTVQLVGHEDSIMWTGFSPSDRYILTVCWDKTARLWTVDGECKYMWKTKQQNWTGCFDPKEEWVVVTCGEGTIYCWSIVTGETLWTIKSPDRGWSRALDISPDRKWLAVGSQGGGRVGLVDLTAETEGGKREWAMHRTLGRGGVVIVSDEEEEEQEQDEGKTEEEKVKAEQDRKAFEGQFITHSIECRSVRFMPTAKGYALGYQCSIDRGLEVYDLEENNKWRCEPVVQPLLSASATRDEIRKAQTSPNDGEEKCGLVGWTVRPDGKVWTIHGDGVRVWNLHLGDL